MTPFYYRNGRLHCDGVPLDDIAAQIDTPFYVYSQQELLTRARAFQAAAPASALVCYAVKANGNPSIIRLLGQEGFGADVTSGGELFLARRGGIPPEQVIFSGVGKGRHEIEEALHLGIRALHVESRPELELIAAVAESVGTVAQIGVRVNPDIRADTHAYISTGLHSHKFGVPIDDALKMLHWVSANRWLQPVGLAVHLGSQITSLEPFRIVAEFLAGVAEELASGGIRLAYLDVGGGLGIDYGEPLGSQQPTATGQEKGERLAKASPTIEEWVETVSKPVADAGFDLVLEPGRSLVGPAGALVTRVAYTKDQGQKRFVIVDAGMNDLIRPALYNAYHPILPVSQADADERKSPVDVVGPVCETGDRLAQDRPMPSLVEDDLLAVLQAGAYGFAMSSNYNGRLRPAEVLVNGERFEVIRKRQTYEHLLDGCEPD